LTLPPPETGKKRAARAPAKPGAGPDPFNHAPNCPRKGQPVEPVALYAQRRVETLRLLFPWEGSVDKEERLQAWAWTLGYSLLAGAERLFALSSRDFEVEFEGVRVQGAANGGILRQGIITFIDPNLGGSGYLERFAERLPEVAAAGIRHLDHEGCDTACYRCLKSYDNQRHHDQLQWPLAVSTLEGLREDTVVAIPLSEADANDPKPWRDAFEAGVASPLEYRCLRLLEGAGLRPAKQFPIVDHSTGRAFTVADFAFPDRRVAVYVDGASIHLGEVLRRDRRIEERLGAMAPSWTVVRLGRQAIDRAPQATIERLHAALG
jgi:very-short-patch-repair endonuclease